MYQGIQQNRRLLWHTSGWNEMFRNRKKRRKRSRVMDVNESANSNKLKNQSPIVKCLNILQQLPQILYLISCVSLMPFFLQENPTIYANCQLMLGYPRSKIHRGSNHLSPSFYNPIKTLRPKDTIYNDKMDSSNNRSNVNDIKLPALNFQEGYNLLDENITSYSTMPTSQEKQNELLRKFSSTMLLETLFRKPSLANRSPFPLLTLPMLRDFTDLKSQIKPQNSKKNSSFSNLDVSTTNRSITTTTNTANQSDIFNSSSLNYLVDKLLSVQPFKDGLNTRAKRPASRYKSPYEANSSGVEPTKAHERYSPPNLGSKTPSMTLDMLIKNEYDSRVEPMLKSLLDQQILSIPSKNSEQSSPTMSKSWPNNHKFNESSTEDTLSNSTESIPTTTSLDRDGPVGTEDTDVDAAVSFEDFEDDEDGHEEDVDKNGEMQEDKKDANEVKSSTSINNRKEEDSSSKRPLQNVPPYQYSNNLDFNKDSFKPMNSVNRQREVPVTTSSTTDPIVNNIESSGSKRESGKVKNYLVFSDGADEAERANKRKIELSRNDKTKNNSFGSRNSNYWKDRKDSDQLLNKTSIPSSSEKSGDSFLLQQLFTTIDPLSELNNKLKEQASVRDPTEISPNNPLIYKGYVGKDDYLLSSTARDWSRPINITEDPPTTLYRYTNNQAVTPGLTTQPPSMPFNYSENQPVTNAQSVPTMVIPTSDPPEITTRYSIKLDTNNRKTEGHNIRVVSPRPPSNGYNMYQNQASTSSDKTQADSNPEIRKYSYQIPERQLTRNQIQYPLNNEQNSISNILNTSKPHVNELKESEYAPMRNKSKSSMSSKPPIDSDRNWSPSRIVPSENLRDDNQRRRQQTLNSAFVTSDNIVNSSSPMFVPIVNMKTAMIMPINATEHAKNMTPNLDVNDIDNNFSTSPILTTEMPSVRVREFSPNNKRKNSFADFGFNQKNTSHKGRWNFQRKKSRVPSPATSTPDTWTAVDQPMGDTDTDTDTDQEVKNLYAGQPKRVRWPTFVVQSISHEQPNNKEVVEVIEDDQRESEGDNDDQSAEKDNNTTQIANSRTVNKSTIGMKQNQTRKAQQNSIKHEPAGSEISLTGLDKNIQLTEGRPRNLTSNRFSSGKPKQSARPAETVLTRGADTSSFPSTIAVDQSSIPSSFGSTIIPNNNFFGDASSESPTVENTIVSMTPDAIGKIHKDPASTVDDVQRINDAQSTTQHTTSATAVSNGTSKVPTSTIQTSAKQDEITTTSSPGQTKPSTKSSNDRIAFILIGGSCALSVVCLVLAAMSMRCQDMCDDYRSLRNAERAALKLQKHRLRYTKNHQINRFNHDRSFTGAVQTAIEDLNPQNHMSDESELEQLRNSKFLNNRSIQFNDPTQKNNNTDLNMWNSSNCQLPLPACINKELQSCKCNTCLNQRWLYPDELLTNSKHLSWLHPYYYMQHHPRLRPLFGAASSVGTFFPRRLEDQSFHGGAGGSIDAQILIDSQPQVHPCNAVDPRGITSSKSILHKGKKLHPKHLSDVNAFREATNVGCNNPEHNHSYHACHNHNHRMISDTSASEESELTFDDSIICDNAKCPNHQNVRHKLGHLKSSGHNHHSLWKPGSVGKPNQPSSHLHHHHNHNHNHQQQQQLSSSDGSSIAQCTCSRDKHPLLLTNNGRHNAQRTSHKPSKHDSKQQAKRDKMVWSTNRDRLI